MQMLSSWNSGTKSTELLLVFKETKGNGFPASLEDNKWKTSYCLPWHYCCVNAGHLETNLTRAVFFHLMLKFHL